MIFQQTKQKAHHPKQNIDQLLEETKQSLIDLKNQIFKKEAQTPKNLIDNILSNFKNHTNTGIYSGFHQIDKLTNGWQKSDLIIIAARPSMGKTAFALSMARNISQTRPVLLFSLEMSKLQLITRLISSQTDVDLEKLRSAKLTKTDWVQIFNTIRPLETAKLYINDKAALSISEFQSHCTEFMKVHKDGIIMVDYLQLMQAPSTNKNEARALEIGRISRGLKLVAKQLNVPIIALSQLSRAVETRAGHQPQLSDLRDSGTIEQDADMVCFLYRPDYYGLDVWPSDGSPSEGMAAFIVAKNRNGALKNIRLRFNKHQARFQEIY